MKIGILSDAHGHIAAANRAMKILEMLGADEILFLGDSVGYIPSTDVADIIARNNIKSLLGNHDSTVINQLFSLDNDRIYQHKKIYKLLKKDTIEHMKKLSPKMLMLSGDLLAVHGSPSNPMNGYIFPDSALDSELTSSQVIVMGHTHRPMIKLKDRNLFVNVGSCALPRDTGGLGACAIIDSKLKSARILRFDITDLVNDVICNYTLAPEVISAMRTPMQNNYFGDLIKI